jgi:hypothetical protein
MADAMIGKKNYGSHFYRTILFKQKSAIAILHFFNFHFPLPFYHFSFVQGKTTATRPIPSNVWNKGFSEIREKNTPLDILKLLFIP